MRKRILFVVMLTLLNALSIGAMRVYAADETRKMEFTGVLCEHKLDLKDFGADIPADWSGYSHLVMEMRVSTPQRFALWVYTADGPRRMEIQPFGENAWFKASVPLSYLLGQVSGNDLAAATNRRSDSFWVSVWGPWGELKSVEAVGFSMDYPINHPVIELRNVHLAKSDEGSKFLETGPNGQMTDQWGQWALGDWPRKIHSQEQLTAELADEAKNFGKPSDFGYGKYYGYASTQAKATGFFRVEQVDGVWWFVDPEGHYFLCTSSNGIGGPGGRGGRRGGGGGGAPAAATPQPAAPNRTNQRLDSWGLTTGGTGRPNVVMLNWPRTPETTFLGLPDVYAADFATGIDQGANNQCTSRKTDAMIVGYTIGNEPPWGNRESEVVDMILNGPDTATKAKLKEVLAAGDTPKVRKQFVVGAFEHYLDLICTAIRKYDPNHLILGIRFGGNPPDAVLRTAHIFDVCSINVYEYEPTKQLERTYRLTGRPCMVTEFHIGVPENGLGAGLVQAMSQTERGVAYRYFVEQAMSLPYCLGDHWFTWRDEPVMGRNDGENYNIGMVDSTDRPYPEFIDAIKATNMRLLDVHSGKALPFNQRPKASEAGTPSSPWDLK